MGFRTTTARLISDACDVNLIPVDQERGFNAIAGAERTLREIVGGWADEQTLDGEERCVAKQWVSPTNPGDFVQRSSTPKC